MYIVDEVYNTIVFQFSSEELVVIFTHIKHKKEREIELLKSKINAYEKKRRVEEAYYQSLSTFRKLFAGRPPSHHQAVEYLVNVKEGFNEIEGIKQQITMLNQLMMQVQREREKERMLVSPTIIEEMRMWKGTEWDEI